MIIKRIPVILSVALQLYTVAARGCPGGQICTEVVRGRMQQYDLGFCERFNACGNTAGCECSNTRTKAPPYIFQQGGAGTLSSYYGYAIDFNYIRFDQPGGGTVSETAHLNETIPMVRYSTTLDNNFIRFQATVEADSIGFSFPPTEFGYTVKYGVDTDYRFRFRVTQSGNYLFKLSETQCPGGINPPPNPRPVRALGFRAPEDDPPVDCFGHYGVSTVELSYYDTSVNRDQETYLFRQKTNSEAAATEQVYLEQNLTYDLTFYTRVYGVKGDTPWTFEIFKI